MFVNIFQCIKGFIQQKRQIIDQHVDETNKIWSSAKNEDNIFNNIAIIDGLTCFYDQYAIFQACKITDNCTIDVRISA